MHRRVLVLYRNFTLPADQPNSGFLDICLRNSSTISISSRIASYLHRCQTDWHSRQCRRCGNLCFQILRYESTLLLSQFHVETNWRSRIFVAAAAEIHDPSTGRTMFQF